MADRPCTGCRRRAEDLLRCSKCHRAWYCSKECQKDHWTAHKPVCRVIPAGEIWAIEILSKEDWQASRPADGDENDRFRYKQIKTNHPIFTRGELCPAVALTGIPLLIFSPAIHGGYQGPGLNHIAVQLRIEPSDAFAPPQWQMVDPGTCVIVRRDGEFLSREVAQTLFAFVKKLLNAAGYPEGDGWAPVQDLMTPAHFQIFSREYFEQQREQGKSGFVQFWSPL